MLGPPLRENRAPKRSYLFRRLRANLRCGKKRDGIQDPPFAFTARRRRNRISRLIVIALDLVHVDAPAPAFPFLDEFTIARNRFVRGHENFPGIRPRRDLRPNAKQNIPVLQRDELVALVDGLIHFLRRHEVAQVDEHQSRPPRIDRRFQQILVNFHGFGGMNIGPQTRGPVVTRADGDFSLFLAARLLAHPFFGQRLGGHAAVKAGAPLRIEQIDIRHDIVFIGEILGDMSGMDELVVRRVDTVLDRTFVVEVPFKDLIGLAPAFLAELGNVHNGRPLRFRQIAEKREDEAVTLDDGIGVDFGPCGDFGVGTHRRDSRAHTVTVELPTVVRALHAIALALSVHERAAAMNAYIAQTMGRPPAVAEKDEVLPQHAAMQKRFSKLIAFCRPVPKIDKHFQPRRSTNEQRYFIQSALSWIDGSQKRFRTAVVNALGFQSRKIIGSPCCAAALALWFGIGVSTCAADELHRATAGEPDTLDPHRTFGATGLIVEFDLFEGLMTYDAAGRLTWGLARSVERSDDGLTYRYTLRDGLVWSDGAPLTGDDFVYSFRRMMDPKTASVYASLYYPLANGRAVNTGRAPPSELGVESPDSGTVVFTLDTPVAFFPKLLGLLGALPVPRHVIDKHEAGWTRPEHIVSNGAYTLEERVHNEFIRLRKNDLYYDADGVRVSRLTYYPMENQDTAFRRFRVGEFQMMSSYPPSKTDWIRENIPEALRISPRMATSFVYFNTEEAPFDDPRVRRALSMAVDREVITDRLLRNGSRPALSAVSPEVSHYTSQTDAWLGKPAAARLREARRLLAEAGYSSGAPLTAALIYYTQEDQRRIAVALQGMWRRIGVVVDIGNVEFRAFAQKRRTGDFQMLMSSTRPGFDDPIAFLTQYESVNIERGNNPARYSNERFDALIEESTRTLDPARRRALLEEAERTMLADHPVAPLFFLADHRLIDTHVRGWVDNPLGRHLSRYLSLRP